jgi:hypothetical protein
LIAKLARKDMLLSVQQYYFKRKQVFFLVFAATSYFGEKAQLFSLTGITRPRAPAPKGD